MANRYTRSNSIIVELTADSFDQRDKEVMQALVTAGALVTLSDGRPKAVERDELLNFIDRQGSPSSETAGHDDPALREAT